MGLIEFVRNYEDLSTERGYQFKFYCDKCGGGWVSEFQVSATGVAGGLLRAAGSFFGGVLGRAASSEYEIRKMTQGKGHDDALKKSVEAAKQRFKKCSRCGQWVCPETCWNGTKGLCEGCAPNLMEEAAAAQAQAAKEQVVEGARKVDQTGGLDLSRGVSVRCPACNAEIAGGKFCPECGAPVSPKTKCAGCGAELKTEAKFCPECGQKQ
jgi:hypothetical protein